MIAFAAKSPKSRKKIVVLGRVTVTVAAGQVEKVRISLNRAGRRLLSTNHTLRAKLAISQSKAGTTSTGSVDTITFKSKPKSKRESAGTGPRQG